MAEPVTLEEVDACIDAADDRGALLVGHWDWFVVRAAQRDLKIRNNGGLNYRDLPVWISDRLRVIGRKEAAELDDI